MSLFTTPVVKKQSYLVWDLGPKFRLRLCEKSYNCKNCKRNQIRRDLGQNRSTKLFPEIIIQKIFLTNFNFQMK